MDTTLIAALLGILEGLTEFLPVSSTGHLMLATEFFGFDAENWRVFNVVIQLGAIMAVVVQYRGLLWDMGMGALRGDSTSLHFVRNILAGFLPAAVLGFLFKDQVNAMLGSPMIVAWALIIGGILILMIERTVPSGSAVGVANLSLSKSLAVGFFQCLAMIPGTSRSGATIMGSLLMGIERKTAAEFSFFLAIPTMIGAATLQIVDNKDVLLSGDGPVGWTQIAVGFGMAFLVAMACIKAFVAYVGRKGFSPFAWYRIALGIVAIVVLSR